MKKNLNWRAVVYGGQSRWLDDDCRKKTISMPERVCRYCKESVPLGWFIINVCQECYVERLKDAINKGKAKLSDLVALEHSLVTGSFNKTELQRKTRTERRSRVICEYCHKSFLTHQVNQAKFCSPIHRRLFHKWGSQPEQVTGDTFCPSTKTELNAVSALSDI